MVGIAHENDRAGAAHAGLGVDAGLPEDLDCVLQVHDFHAQNGCRAGLGRGSLNFFFGSSGLGSGLAGFQNLAEAGLLGLGEFFLCHVKDLAADQLGRELKGIGNQGCAGGTGDDEDQLVVVHADARAVAIAGGLEAAAGGIGGEHFDQDVAGQGVRRPSAG